MIIEDVTLIHKKLPLEVEQINISVGCFQNVMKVGIYECITSYREVSYNIVTGQI